MPSSLELLVRRGTIEEVTQLSREIPELDLPLTYEEYRKRLTGSFVILVADMAGVAVGFKVGYDRFKDGKVFYGWIGGVHPSQRKMGVGKLLLEKMELWCKVTGYQYLQFNTENRNKSMMSFAVSHGYDVIDFRENDDTALSKIFFQKKL